MSLDIETWCVTYGEAPNLIEHEKFEGESHACVRVAIPKQLPVKHIALLQKKTRIQFDTMNKPHCDGIIMY
jgi:hypothetical protein